MNNPTESISSDLRALYNEIDRRTAELAALHTGRLKCGPGCCGCCLDGLTVWEVEAQNIAAHYAELLEKGQPREKGLCAFLDEQGACRIYDQRPYVCRTQGLPLHWIEEGEDGEPFALRDICPLNEQGPSVEQLPVEQCWVIGEAEARLAEMQRRAGGMLRFGLRELFIGQKGT